MSSYKVPIIVVIIALVAAAAGLGAARMASSDSGAAETHLVPPPPARMTEPFTINLADTDALHYVKLGVAVQLAPMSEEDLHIFEAGGVASGGHGASGPTGPEIVGNFGPLRDAVITATSTFTSTQLLSADGKEKLKSAIVTKMNEGQAQSGFHRPKEGEEAHWNVAMAPYDVKDIYFTEFAVQ